MPENVLLLGLTLACLLAGPAQAASTPALEEGNRALEAGRLEDAETHYLRGFVDSPDSPALHYSVGLAKLRKGELDEAAQLFQKAAGLAESSGATGLAARAHYNRGLALATPSFVEQEGGASPPPPPAPGGQSAVLSTTPAPGSSGIPGLPQGLAGMGGAPNPEEMKALKSAQDSFQKAILLDSADLDAKYNYGRVEARLKELEQQQQNCQNPQQKDGDPQQQEDQKDSEKDQDKGKDGQKGDQKGPEDPKDQKSPPDQKDPDQKDQQGPQGGERDDPGQDDDQNQQGEQDQRDQQGSSAQPKQTPRDIDEAEPLDKQAMERQLDALEAEELDQLKRFLRNRRASPRSVTHAW